MSHRTAPGNVLFHGARIAALLFTAACSVSAPGATDSDAQCRTGGACAAAGTGDDDAAAANETIPGFVACVTSPVVARPVACTAMMSPADSLDTALAKVSRDRCSFGHTLAALETSKLDVADPRALVDMAPLLQRSLDLPAYGASLAKDLDAALLSGTPVARAIAAAAPRRGAPVSACEDAAWYGTRAGDAAPLATALLDVGAPAQDTSNVPRELQSALAPIVRALAATTKDVQAARKADAATLGYLATVPTWMLGVRHFELDETMLAALDAVDVDAIVRAAARVALVVERARLSRFAGMKLPDVTLTAPFGRVVLRGSGSRTYAANDEANGAAFLLDTGGDDVYRIGVGASTVAVPIAIAVDLGGRDTYAYTETRVPEDNVGKRLASDGAGRVPNDGRTLSRTPRQGAGVLGVGLLFDLGGDADTYRSLVGSQGVGSHGVGVLLDDGGDDTYVAEGFSQGAAAWGLGLALDLSGNDARTLYTSGQGFGFTKGVGAIVDAKGDDTYVAIAGAWSSAPPSLAGDMLYPSAQLPGPPATPIAGNWSLAQGVGAGHRPDWPDPGFPFPGGIGVLRDAAGNDTYGAGVFAQGGGFVQGLGMLLDDAGNDAYDALYYAQGAAAHMGLSLFDDRAGNDRYDTRVPLQAAALGFAHDLSSAVHLDEAGNDTYAATGLTLGVSEDNGTALFVNAGGADSFTAAGDCLGVALMETTLSATRQRLPTVAVFLKAGGTASYRIDQKSVAHAGKTWGDDHDGRNAAGLDQPAGRATLH